MEGAVTPALSHLMGEGGEGGRRNDAVPATALAGAGVGFNVPIVSLEAEELERLELGTEAVEPN